MIQRFPRIPLWPALLCVAALAFCGWNIWGSPETLCVTEGCKLFQDFTIAGVSLWLLGAIAFTVLLLLALLGQTEVACAAAALGVLLDCGLLIIMITSAPCFNCMIIGLLLALTFLAFKAVLPQRNKSACWWKSPLFALWSLIFLLDAGIVAHSMLRPWHFPTLAPDAAVRVWFSPSCSACRALAEATEKEAGSLLWFPVAEKDSDIPLIADMARRVEAGASVPDALKAVLREKEPEIPFTVYMMWQLRLWRNKAHVLDAGSQRLPFVEFSGAPDLLLHKKDSNSPSGAEEYPAAQGGNHGLSSVENSLFGVSGYCAEDEPCEGPKPSAPSSLHELMNSPVNAQ